MAWYPYRRNYWRRRRNWIFPRRFRKAFPRRRRYPRRRVRKLKSLIIRQFQPPVINKCHVKGIECLCLFNQDRLAFNSTMYRDSFVPPNFPGGGGFAVMKFTLQNLYDMHKFCSNWWTKGNQDLPLVRYLGLKLKLYQSEKIDYVLKYSTALPAVSNKLTYPSTQPSMMLMSHNKVIVPSRQTRQRRKPYTTLHIKPTEQLFNKWYFQKDFTDTPLVVLYATPVSLTNYYINPEADNNNITITYINTQVVNNRNFREAHWASKTSGTNFFYIYIYTGIKPLNNPENFQNSQIIPLTNIRQWTLGSTFEDAKRNWSINKEQYYGQISKYTGNPFTREHLQHQNYWFWSHTGPQTWADKAKTLQDNSTVSEIKITGTTSMTLTPIAEPITKECRYNPFKDNGSTTKMYLLKCNDNTHTNNSWDPPPEPDKILEGFPMWLNIWGFVDFQIRLGTYENILTNTILVIQNQTTDPKIQTPIVPIDLDYLNDRSPHEPTVNTSDKNRWYPQVQYQTQQINNIALTGPGTTKLPSKTSEQITIKYDFTFKWGGNPAKMITVNNPNKQIIYPLPRDESSTNSLQSPAQAIETMLYSFDERDNQITKRALERISKDWDFTNILSSITETTRTLPATSQFPQTPQETATQEKEKEEILQQLIQHKYQQQQLRLRILSLMKDLNM
nr:MAG: ORF1 [TTV-like mini virus]